MIIYNKKAGGCPASLVCIFMSVHPVDESFLLSTNRQGQEKLLITDGKRHLVVLFSI